MKKVISILITFILIIIILSTSLLTIATNTFLNKSYMLSVLEKNNYYEKTDKNVQEAFRNYILQSGLEEEVLDNLYEKEKIKEDVDAIITSIYEKKTYTVDTSSIKKNLETKIENILKENKKKLTNKEKEAIDKFVVSITNAYENEIQYSEKVVSKLQGVVITINKIAGFVKIPLYIALAVLVVILVLINKNLKYIAISVISVGMILCVIYFLINTNIGIQNILFVNQAFSEVLIYIMSNVLNLVLWSGIGSLVIGVLGSLLSVWGRTPK